MLSKKRIHVGLLSVFFFTFVGLFQQCAPAQFGAIDSAYGKAGDLLTDNAADVDTDYAAADDGKKVDDLAMGDDDDIESDERESDADKKDVADNKDQPKSREMTCDLMMQQYVLSLQVPCNRGKSKICVPTHKPHPTQAGRCIAEKLTPLESIKGILNGKGGHVIGRCNAGLQCPGEGA
jgi:hypothetical protein